MTTSDWPPPITEDTLWRTVVLAAEGHHRVREVRLWGTNAWLAEDGRVLCNCGSLVTVEELCLPGNGHYLSPVGGRTSGVLDMQATYVADGTRP